MTNELEKQFFQCFGIEPNCQNTFINPSKCPFNKSRECCNCVSFEYPQITDTHYLKLICILSKELRMIFRIISENLEDLKKEILQKCISNYYCYSDELAPNHQWFYEYKHQVRTLFEEG